MPTIPSFDLLVFDWDGTLCDSTAVIVQSIQAACIDVGLAPPSPQDAAYVIGMGLAAAMQHVAPDLPLHLYPELAERYRVHYVEYERTVELFRGVHELLHELRQRDFRLAVATGKSRRGLDVAMDQTQSGGYFHATRTADETEPKPHPRMLHELIAELQTTPERTLMIGDTTHDLQLAAAAGTPALAVSYGAHPLELLVGHNPLAIVHSIDELTQWLYSRH